MTRAERTHQARYLRPLFLNLNLNMLLVNGVVNDKYHLSIRFTARLTFGGSFSTLSENFFPLVSFFPFSSLFLESILPNFDFLLFQIFVVKLVCMCIGKYCLYIKTAKFNSKKTEKSSFYKEKSLVGLTPAG